MPLLEDRAIAVCGPQTALAVGAAPFPKLLEKAPLLPLEGEPEWGGLLATLPRPARTVRRAATIQDERLLLHAAEHELGIACLSELLASASIAERRLVHLEAVPPRPRPRLWLMRSRLTPRTPIANKAFDWLLAEASGRRC